MSLDDVLEGSLWNKEEDGKKDRDITVDQRGQHSRREGVAPSVKDLEMPVL